METVNCYLLFVICNAKNPFPKTVNCQTVTLVTDDTDSLWGDGIGLSSVAFYYTEKQPITRLKHYGL